MLKYRNNQSATVYKRLIIKVTATNSDNALNKMQRTKKGADNYLKEFGRFRLRKYAILPN